MENIEEKTNSMIGIGVVLIILAALAGWWFGSSQPMNQGSQSSKEQVLAYDMNKLWEDHITWTRLYLVSATNNLPDKDQVLNRLMKNQEDLGNAIKPYYGNEAGDQLTTLLKDHIKGAGEVVAAAVNKDAAGVEKANAAWHENGDQIADFLASANSNWSKDDMRAMMKDHLDLTLQEAQNILDKKAEASIDDYDKVHNQILHMSDMLSAGIIKQFPDKF